MPDVGVVKRSSGLTTVALGDVAYNSTVATETPVADGFSRYIIGKHIPGDGSKITTWNQIGDGEFGSRIRTIIKPGDIVCTTRGPKLRVAVATFDCLSAHTNFILRTKNPSVLMQEFLQAVACSDGFQDHLRRHFRGSTNLFVNWSDAAKYEFTLPTQGDQRRIAELLHTLDSATEYSRRLLLSLRVVEVSLFSALVARHRAKLVRLGDVLAEAPRNGYSAIETSAPTNHWVLALSALTPWGYRRGELKAVEHSAAIAASVLRKGDFLISRSNTRELVGLPGIFDEDRSDVSWPDTMMRLVPDETRLQKRFLELFLRSPAGRRQVQSFAAGTSASMKKINSAHVRRIELPLLPLSLQASIEGAVESCFTAQARVYQHLEKLMGFRHHIISETVSLGRVSR